MSKILAEFLNNELDQKTPYKITAPKHSLVPLRFDKVQEAITVFTEITEKGKAAILTYNNFKTKTCKILMAGPDTIYSLSKEE
ncbi:hypothetical protein K7A41_09460 [Sphingobacterium sp. InxBP1]|uniref:hypothetical protein n=1 Tax=Sphingobacterium sp. InxBP1 TaxID=2870328 RepID=UPI0022440BBF|nr:hypothetical protein [Sphingobacterium sp. InxBP1]MCW8311449.1 hypothetical protein [Sphingobacterium sp. InxBP1]